MTSAARVRGRVRVALATAVAVGALGAASEPASAGRLLATGHDADCHASAGNCGPNLVERHFLKTAVDWVRDGAPDPTKPILALTCSYRTSSDHDLGAGLDATYGEGQPARTIMCPSSSDFTTEPLTTERYSAIVVGSSCDNGGHVYSLNGVNCASSTPDSDALARRHDDIAAFFNAGGGVLALAGHVNGDNDPSTGPDTYYDFMPLPVGGRSVTAPFALTDLGRVIGFEDATHGIGTNDDINCCPTHNSFAEPAAGSAIKVAERDGMNAPETLVAGGRVEDGRIVEDPDYPTDSKNPLGLPPNKKCVDRRKFRFTIHQPQRGKVRIVDAYVGKKRVKHVVGDPVSKIRLPVLPQGKFTLKIVATTTNATQTISTRKYNGCKKSRPHTHVHHT